jgi:hypothetical protein
MNTLQYDPQYVNRFTVIFPEELNIKPYTVQNINKPKKMNGKWENITISFIDIINSSPVPGIYQLISQKRRTLKTNVIEIYDIDSQGKDLNKWMINIDKIISIDFGYNDYNIADIQYITLVIKPSNCTYHTLYKN